MSAYSTVPEPPPTGPRVRYLSSTPGITEGCQPGSAAVGSFLELRAAIPAPRARPDSHGSSIAAPARCAAFSRPSALLAAARPEVTGVSRIKSAAKSRRSVGVIIM